MIFKSEKNKADKDFFSWKFASLFFEMFRLLVIPFKDEEFTRLFAELENYIDDKISGFRSDPESS